MSLRGYRKLKVWLIKVRKDAFSKMLCFDIETTGLDANRCKVTVVCTEDFVSGVRTAYEFARYPEKYDEIRMKLIQSFDESLSLCAFNGIRFDLPFLVKFLKIPEEKHLEWAVKTSDILEQSRLRFKKTFSLNLLCETNNIAIKISDGLAAIKMAEEQKWDELVEYCEQDVRILCDLYRKRHLIHPRTKLSMDVRKWCRDNLYDEEPYFLHYARHELGWPDSLCEACKKTLQNLTHVTQHKKIEHMMDKNFDAESGNYVQTHNVISCAFSNYLTKCDTISNLFDRDEMHVETE